jgi:hypothetical protein
MKKRTLYFLGLMTALYSCTTNSPIVTTKNQAGEEINIELRVNKTVQDSIIYISNKKGDIIKYVNTYSVNTSLLERINYNPAHGKNKIIVRDDEKLEYILTNQEIEKFFEVQDKNYKLYVNVIKAEMKKNMEKDMQDIQKIAN